MKDLLAWVVLIALGSTGRWVWLEHHTIAVWVLVAAGTLLTARFAAVFAWRRFWQARLLITGPDPQLGCWIELPDQPNTDLVFEALRLRHKKISEAGACPACGPGLPLRQMVLAQRRVLKELDEEAGAELRGMVPGR